MDGRFAIFSNKKYWTDSGISIFGKQIVYDMKNT